MSNLADHARRELVIIGEEPETIDWYVRVIDTFNEMGHSGSSAAITTQVLNRLLQWQPLTDLTNDPHEWMFIADDIAGMPNLWQSLRNPEAFSNDGGITYYLLSERVASPGGMETTPLHRSQERPADD